MALARPTCLYCGAPLDALALRAAEAGALAPEPERPGPETAEERGLAVGVLEDADPERLREALGCSLVEARQHVLRRGPELLGLKDIPAAEAFCVRLAGCGGRARVLPEAHVRRLASPWLAIGGRQTPEARLKFRGASDERVLAPGAILLIVQGPIQREYLPRVAKRPRTATLEQGYRIHLHLPSDEPPVELDPGGFEFDAESGPASSLLRLRRWLEGLAVDDRFRFLAPALGPEEPAEGGALAATRGLRRRGGGDESQILDNLRQFRFYSAWRGAWERAEAG